MSSQPTCLIVDDDLALRRIIGHTVQRAGMATAECATLDDVVREIGRANPRLIFLDVGLQGTTAPEVLELLAESQCDAFVQIVSGRDEEELADIEEAGLDLGMRMLPPLRKPFRGADIARIVEGLQSETAGE